MRTEKLICRLPRTDFLIEKGFLGHRKMFKAMLSDEEIIRDLPTNRSLLRQLSSYSPYEKLKILSLEHDNAEIRIRLELTY